MPANWASSWHCKFPFSLTLLMRAIQKVCTVYHFPTRTFTIVFYVLTTKKKKGSTLILWFQMCNHQLWQGLIWMFEFDSDLIFLSRSHWLWSCWTSLLCPGGLQRQNMGHAGAGRMRPEPVAVVGRVPGTVIWCKTNNKNHIARDFHSVTAQQVTTLCFHSRERSFSLCSTSFIVLVDLIYCSTAVLFGSLRGE